MYKDNDLNFISRVTEHKLNGVQRNRRRFNKKIKRYLNKELGILDISWSIMTMLVRRFITDLLLSYFICMSFNLSLTFMWIFVICRIYVVSSNMIKIIVDNLE